MTAAAGQALQSLLVHLATVGALPSLLADAGSLGAKAVSRAGRVRAVNLFAELALVAAHAVALAVGAVSVTVAVRHLALVMAKRALLALPAGIALALAVDVLAALAAEHRADALAAVLAAEAWIALAVAEQTLAFAAATVRAVVSHVLGDHGDQADLLWIAVVVVEREEPMAGFHVVRHFFLDRRLMRTSGSPSLETTEHLEQVILRVCRQCVSPGVDADACTSWDIVVEFDVGRLRLVELHVPVAVSGNFLVEALA